MFAVPSSSSDLAPPDWLSKWQANKAKQNKTKNHHHYHQKQQKNSTQLSGQGRHTLSPCAPALLMNSTSVPMEDSEHSLSFGFVKFFQIESWDLITKRSSRERQDWDWNVELQ